MAMTAEQIDEAAAVILRIAKWEDLCEYTKGYHRETIRRIVAVLESHGLMKEDRDGR